MWPGLLREPLLPRGGSSYLEELLSDALRRCRTAIPSAADIARTVIACADRLAKECEEMRRKSDDRWTDQSVGVSVVFSRNGQHVSFEWDWKQGLKQGLMNDDAAPTEIPVLQMNRECYERLRDRYRHHRGDPAREKSRLVVMLLKYHALQLGDHGQHAALPPEAMNALREGEPFIIFTIIVHYLMCRVNRFWLRDRVLCKST